MAHETNGQRNNCDNKHAILKQSRKKNIAKLRWIYAAEEMKNDGINDKFASTENESFWQQDAM